MNCLSDRSLQLWPNESNQITDQYLSSHNPFHAPFQYGGLFLIAAVFQFWKSSIQNLSRKKQMLSKL